MAPNTISFEKTAFLRYELENGDSRRQKVALQDICRLYRSGFRLKPEARNGFEKSVNGMVLSASDVKVIRWCLNALAQLGRLQESGKYIEITLAQHQGKPEIVAAGVAALSRFYQGNLEVVPILKSVDPAIRILAALQNTDPEKLDLSGFRINIDIADPEVLKLALITVGLNRDIENLFHPKHNNGQIVKALGQHDDPIVRQYCVWSVLENRRISISDLGVPFSSIPDQPSNVQAKLLQLAAEKEMDERRRHEIILNGTYIPAIEAREGLAKGILNNFYDGLQDITINWFELESSDLVKELIAEHFGRYAHICRSYEDKAMEIAESEPAFRKRLLLGSEGKALYGKIKASDVRDGTPDLFSGQVDDLSMILQRGRVIHKENFMKKALILSASPRDEVPLRLDEEARDLNEQLQLVRKPAVTIQVEHRWAVRTNQIQGEILNVRPSILHFSGHGNRGSLCFEDNIGNAAPVSAKAIAELIAVTGSIECLILNACYSKSIADLVAPHLQAVVGCDGTIDDQAAIAFARAFYRAVAHGRSYEEAYSLARNEVRLNCADEEAEKFIFSGKI